MRRLLPLALLALAACPTPPEPAPGELDTQISSGPSGTLSAPSVKFEFSSPRDGATFECHLDGAAFRACSSPATYAGLSSGSHLFEVRAVDGDVKDPSPAKAVFTLDLTAPDTELLSGPSGVVTAFPVSFEFTATEQGARFECALDGAAFAACTSPHAISELADGSHRFEVRAIDALGNADASPANRDFTVDRYAPETQLDAAPSGTIPSDTTTVAFSSSEAGSTFECALDAGAFVACTSPRTLTGLSDGAHRFFVRAIDAGGNVDATPASASFTVDQLGPNTALDATPVDPTSSTSATFAFSSDDPSAHFECRLDSAAFAACTSPVALSGLAEGAHAFDVRGIDAANNVDPTPAHFGWTVDLTAPQTTIASGPAATISSTSASFTLTSETGATFLCSLDGAAFASCPASPTVTGLSEGPHTFQAAARDLAGNVDATPAQRSFTVDRTAPDTAISSGPTTGTTSGSATFVFSSPDATASFECKLDSGTFAACSSPKSYSSLASGGHHFEVRAKDPAGNIDSSPAGYDWSITSNGGTTRVRIVASNLSSASNQSYPEDSPGSLSGPGIRLLQGVHADVILLQEFNFRSNTDADLQLFASTVGGPGFYVFREPTDNNSCGTSCIPNGIVSRWPIIASGDWKDPTSTGGNRDFAWARIDIPGPRDLWVISVHLKASGGSTSTEATQRDTQAQVILSNLQDPSNAIPAGDYVAMGGDFNTSSRTESCLGTLGGYFDVAAPFPVDQKGDGDTNSSRGSPYDWVLADADLRPLQTATLIGSSTYLNGLVLDSRIYTPLSEVSPALASDSGASGMQHMAVVKDFLVPN